MPGSADIERDPELSDRELMAAVKGRSERLAGTRALKALTRRGSSRTALLAEVLVDPEQPPDLRAAAAVNLGQEKKARNQEVLASALEAAEPSVVRRAAEALGRVGDERALERLASIRPRGGPARQSVHFAKTLISYRNGLDENHLRKPPEREFLGSTGLPGAPLAVEKVPPDEAARLVADAQGELPGIPVSAQPAFRFSCDGSTFALVFSREVTRRKTLTIGGNAAVPAVVLKHSAELEKYYLYEYLLTHPKADGTLQLFGMRSVGIMIHAGEMWVEGSEAHFELRALDKPMAPPVHISGTYDHAEATLTMSLAAGQRTAEAAARRDAPGAPAKLEASFG